MRTTVEHVVAEYHEFEIKLQKEIDSLEQDRGLTVTTVQYAVHRAGDMADDSLTWYSALITAITNEY